MNDEQELERLALASERHEMQIRSLQHQINDVKDMTKQMKTMGDTLITLTGELKHTNESLKDHNERITNLEGVPKMRVNTVINAVLTAAASALAGFALAHFFGI